MSKSIILFDFDGTLADSMPAICATARAVLLERGMTEEEMGDLRRLVGPPFPAAWSLAFGFDEKTAAEVTAAYRKRYEKLGLEAWPLFEGMRELLEDLKARGVRLGIVSSKRQTVVQVALKDNKIDGLFDIVCAKKADSFNFEKQDALKEALHQAEVGPEAAVMVGDRHFDIDAAHACDVESIGVLYGNTAEGAELEEAGATWIAATLDDLRARLFELVD